VKKKIVNILEFIVLALKSDDGLILRNSFRRLDENSIFLTKKDQDYLRKKYAMEKLKAEVNKNIENTFYDNIRILDEEPELNEVNNG